MMSPPVAFLAALGVAVYLVVAILIAAVGIGAVGEIQEDDAERARASWAAAVWLVLAIGWPIGLVVLVAFAVLEVFL